MNGTTAFVGFVSAAPIASLTLSAATYIAPQINRFAFEKNGSCSRTRNCRASGGMGVDQRSGSRKKKTLNPHSLQSFILKSGTLSVGFFLYVSYSKTFG